MAKDLVRVTVNLMSNLVEDIDEYAKNMNINRTSAVSVLLTEALGNQKVMSDLNDLLKIWKSQNMEP